MKNLICFIFVLSTLLIWNNNVSSQEWSDPISVPGGINPFFDLDKTTGDLYISSMYNGVFLAKYDKDGTFISEESVPGANDDRGETKWGACVAIDKQGYPHVMYRKYWWDKKNHYSGYYIYKSAAGWSTPLEIYHQLYRAYQPKLDVDEQGRVHILWGQGGMDHLRNEDPYGIFGPINYRRIEDGIVTAEKNEMWWYRADVNFEMMCTDDGEVHLATGKGAASSGHISYYNSLDEGVTWHGYGDLHDSNADNANGFVDIFIDKEKHIHYCYANEKDANWRCPTIRYIRVQNDGTKIRDIIISDKNEIEAVHLKLGISSVAASEDGQYVMIAYSTSQDGGNLYTRLSTDGGANWGNRELIAENIDLVEGRSRQYIRAIGHRFFLVYPHHGPKLRILQIPGFEGPQAEANGPYNGQEGSPIEFSAAGSSDNSGIATYAWDWDSDGTFDDSTTSETISHTFSDEYDGNVTLRIRSNEGQMATATAQVTVSNVAPTVDSGDDVSVDEGAALAFSATVTDPGTEDELTYHWDFGDGASSTETNPSHAYRNNGDFTASLTVNDGDGGQGQDQITVTVRNVAPTADAGGPYNVKPGESLNVTGSASDPGVDDVFTYDWDMDGDGTYEVVNQQQTTGTYNTNGIYTIWLRVTDDAGGVGIDDAKVVVGSAAPVITQIPAQSIQEGNAFEPISLDGYVSDPDDDDDVLTWSSHNNINLTVAINNRVAAVTTPNADWTGSETILFIVTDPGGESDSANVVFTVTNVNDAPVANQIPNQTRKEGSAFSNIQLDLYVYDVDNGPDEMSWSASGNSNLLVNFSNRIATITPADSEWAGSETITFTVTDPGNLSDNTAATFTITVVNDPPQINNFPAQETDQYQSFPQVSLDDCVFDPDNQDSQILWTYFGNAHISLSISNRILNATVNDPEWFGSENITFVATDPGQKQGTKSVVFKVNKVDATPRISPIADQTINEGESFNSINLDDHVEDINNEYSQLTWSWSGQVELNPALNGHILTIAIPDSDWFGQEMLQFIVRDPAGLSDTTSVTFTVLSVNDSPVITGLADVTFDEDGFCDIPLSVLQNHTTDADHSVSELVFGLQSDGEIIGQYCSDTQVLKITTIPDYCGSANAKIIATDPENATGHQSITVTVNPLPDIPRDFDLIQPVGVDLVTWLPELDFIWQHSIDPDPGDYVTYRWLLSRNEAFADTFLQANVGSDSFFVPITSRRMYKGNYYWKIIASSSDGSVKESAVAGFSLLFAGVDDQASTDIPKKFALLPNHPNPFNPETNITYHLPKASEVRLEIYNSLGRRVSIIDSGQRSAGVHSVVWNARDSFNQGVSSGIYFCRLVAGREEKLIKMMLLQ